MRDDIPNKSIDEVFLRLAYVSIGINDSSMDGELIVNLLYVQNCSQCGSNRDLLDMT